MIKKDIYNRELKTELKASSKDRLYRFILSDGMVRGAIVKTTSMVNQMSANHNLGEIETLVLGQGYIAASLLTANLKSSDRISLNIDCSGVIKGLDVDSNAFGEIRGYLKNPTFSKELSGAERSLSSLFGAGFLTVTKYLTEAKTPYSGKIILEYGTVAEDLANYFLKSEQTPTAFNLSLHFNDSSNGSDESNFMVDGAGGLFLQAMPGADLKVVDEAEKIMSQLSYSDSALSLSSLFANNVEPDILILEKFETMSPILLGNYRVEFFCRCNLKTITNYISKLPQDELVDIAKNGPFPLEIRCNHCNTLYQFNQPEIEKMIKKS
ncbi:MAG: Hsp33 family molecular chaperone HslO [Desulfamplus sp.]|nr:Hsp33 family molecular chaperone HslO [Desulfamplus sp.]MBF0243269.1 Hsp33 family molecular chaperone HslO [Desulfamplus sp.]